MVEPCQNPSTNQKAAISATRVVQALIVIGAIVNTCLAVLKLWFGRLTGFYALFADGIHTLSDLLTDTLVFVASLYSGQAADESHPYGHQRIETAATFILSLLLVVTGWFIIYQSYLDAFRPVSVTHYPTVIVVIVVSLLVKELLFWVTLFYARRFNSALLRANAWHHRSDGLSSLVVLIGAVLQQWGWLYADVLAAAIVGCSVIYMGWYLGWNSFKELIDTALAPEAVKRIYDCIRQTTGVVAVHQLRTRSMAGRALLDVHILVDPMISVSEGHFIAQNVALKVRDVESKVGDVTVHVDPEDDESVLPCLGLPDRVSLSKQIEKIFQRQMSQSLPERCIIHYLDGQIQIELYGDWQIIGAEIEPVRQQITAMPNVKAVSFYQACHR